MDFVASHNASCEQVITEITRVALQPVCVYCDGDGRIGPRLDHCPACGCKKPRVLKTWPEYFQAVWDGKKTFEIRDCSDRGFTVGDFWILDEWDRWEKKRTGRAVMVKVTYLTDFAQKPGFVVWAFEIVAYHRDDSPRWLSSETNVSGEAPLAQTPTTIQNQ